MAVAIKVRYFASLKENLGRDSDNLDFEKVISVDDVWARAVPTESMPDNTLATANIEFVALNHQVIDGATGARFLQDLADAISQIETIANI